MKHAKEGLGGRPKKPVEAHKSKNKFTIYISDIDLRTLGIDRKDFPRYVDHMLSVETSRLRGVNNGTD